MMILGAVVVLWALWFMPRQFSRIRDRIGQSGNSTQRFDAMLKGRSYRLAVVAGVIAGVVLIAAGAALVVFGE
jgi:uncharacterized membrane protein